MNNRLFLCLVMGLYASLWLLSMLPFYFFCKMSMSAFNHASENYPSAQFLLDSWMTNRLPISFPVEMAYLSLSSCVTSFPKFCAAAIGFWDMMLIISRNDIHWNSPNSIFPSLNYIDTPVFVGKLSRKINSESQQYSALKVQYLSGFICLANKWEFSLHIFKLCPIPAFPAFPMSQDLFCLLIILEWR